MIVNENDIPRPLPLPCPIRQLLQNQPTLIMVDEQLGGHIGQGLGFVWPGPVESLGLASSRTASGV